MDYKDKVIELIKSKELTSEQVTKLEEIFPELKESEDEKIRKMIINTLNRDKILTEDEAYDCVAWLEKQGTKISIYSNTLFKIATILSQYEDKDDSPLEKIRSIMIDGTICSMDLESKNKKQGEQKPTDEEMKILLQTEYKKSKADAIEAAMESVTKDKESAIKFLKSAGIMNENGELAKEYVVNNVEQKSAWSEEDKNSMCDTLSNLTELKDRYGEGYGNVGKCIDWLKSIKDRVRPKQEWSEEDKKMLKEIISDVKFEGYNNDMQANSYRKINWLKSLRPQNTWKPSEEQMDALESAIVDSISSIQKHSLESLYNELKKLF